MGVRSKGMKERDGGQEERDEGKGGVWHVWPSSTRLSTDLLLSRAPSYNSRPPDGEEDTTGPADSTPDGEEDTTGPADSTPAALTSGTSPFPPKQ